MADFNRIEDLANATAYDVDGDKVGGVKDVYVNDTTGQPDFVSVNHGLFGGGDSIVPLRGHTLRDGELHLAFQKDRIEDAPDLDENGHLTTEDQDAFYRHYGLENTQDVTTYETGNRFAETGAAGAAGAAGAGAGYAAGERNVETDVDTERRDVVDADRANYDGNISEQEASVTLSEDRVNVSKESVPVEKVSLEKDTVRDTETVSEEVRKERFETDGVVEGDVEGDINKR